MKNTSEREHRQQHSPEEHSEDNAGHDEAEPLSHSENVPLEDDIAAEEERRRLEDAQRNAIVSVEGKDVNASTDIPPAKPRDRVA
jgi:hypothetical protein